MTNLVLSYGITHIQPFTFPKVRETILNANRNGVVSILLLSGLVLGIGSYITFSYLTISTGLAMQERLKEIERMNKTITADEIVIQQKVSGLAESHSDLLQSMEKVSSIRYITTENFVFSR